MKNPPKMKHGIGNAWLLSGVDKPTGKSGMKMGPKRKSKSGSSKSPMGERLGPQK